MPGMLANVLRGTLLTALYFAGAVIAVLYLRTPADVTLFWPAAGIGYALIGGLTFSLFLGFVSGLASFLPFAGPALIWAGTAIFLVLTGSVGRGIGLALWGALVVSTADNLIKPLLIGGRARLPTFLLLISILGGLKVYGFLSVFLGPVILATLISFVDIYREEYADAAAPAADTSTTTDG